jgi:hypothetical protein
MYGVGVPASEITTEGDGSGHRSHLAADVQQHVRLFDGPMRMRVETVVADHAQRQRVLVRHGSLPGDGGHHRRAQPLSQLDHFRHWPASG